MYMRLQSLPQCFVDKMNVDNALGKLRAFPIINFDEAKNLLAEQRRARRLCKLNVERTPAGRAGAA